MNTSSPMTTAFVRALYSAVIAGALAGLTATQQGSSDREAIIIGLIAALGILGTRGLVEGTYDQHRNAVGNVKPGDVGSHLPPIA